MIVVDTNVILDAYDRDSHRHKASREVLTTTEPLITTPYVLTEVDYALTRLGGATVALMALRDISSLMTITEPAELRDIAFTVMEKYPFAGLVDASLVALAAVCETVRIATWDHRHFRTMTPLQGGDYFVLLPEDS